MNTEIIPLQFGGTRIAHLRELTGHDESNVLAADTANAIKLLSSLTAEPVNVMDLVAADRDLLLAAVYEKAFGDRIDATLTCARCSQPFDLYFSLEGLVDAAHARSAATNVTVLGEGRFQNSDGVYFRLPTGHDELALAGFRSEQAESSLLQSSMAESNWPHGPAAFQEWLEQVAPILHFDLVAQCAECGHVHNVEFDVQSYVLGSIVAERPKLLSDIHRIAKAYSWTLDEILSLRRSDRRQIVELIESGS